MKAEKTFEPQLQKCVTLRNEQGMSSLGLLTNIVWHEDPRRLGIVLARYKFVAKMFSGMKSVLEIGCGDGFASRLVKQEVAQLTITDADQLFIDDINSRMNPNWEMSAICHNMLDGAYAKDFDGAFALDVLEHIDPSLEQKFITNIIDSLNVYGVMILGMPSLESQTYASAASKIGHVNCKTQADFKALMQLFFHNVFMFSMNDEMLHVGYPSMGHYNLAVCSMKR